MGKLCIGIIAQKDLVSSSDAVAHQLMDFSHILWRRYKSKSLHCPKTKNLTLIVLVVLLT